MHSAMPPAAELDVDARAAEGPEDPHRPRLRGRIHQVAFFVSIPAGVLLFLSAQTTTARVACGIYGASLTGLYGSSAAYHRLRWSAEARHRMKRLDHSMIFILIAGTYTPFCLLVLDTPWSVVLLSLVWAGAAVGIALKLVDVDRLRVATGVLYVTLGWLAILAAPQIVRRLSGMSLALLAAGGILYTGGAIVLARRRPDPAPRTFGYHEIWHAMVVGASACHYTLLLLLLAR